MAKVTRLAGFAHTILLLGPVAEIRPTVPVPYRARSGHPHRIQSFATYTTLLHAKPKPVAVGALSGCYWRDQAAANTP